MNRRAFPVFLLILLSFTSIRAQVSESRPGKERKATRIAGQEVAFAQTDSLVNSRQFVFQADGDVEVFVLVDSLFGEIQDGNRNNLQGYITQFEVRRNEKKKQLSVSIILRGVMHTADVVLFMDASGKGKATVLAEFPHNFSFIGDLYNFEDAWIYEGPSHLVH